MSDIIIAICDKCETPFHWPMKGEGFSMTEANRAIYAMAQQGWRMMINPLIVGCPDCVAQARALEVSE